MRIFAPLAAAALAISPVAAFAQAGVDTTAMDATAAPAEQEDEFPWGLLGLLGLAGLLGAKRRDDHRDNRRAA